MSLRTLEIAILAELWEVSKIYGLRMKDVMEWRTGDDLPIPEGETRFYLPRHDVTCSVKIPNEKTLRRRR